MASNQFPHLFIHGGLENINYRAPQARGGSNIPNRSREEHGTRLQRQLEDAWTRVRENKETRSAASLPTKDGMYIEFVGQPGFDLVTKSLESMRSGIRLLNVKKAISRDSEEVFSATVYIPAGKESHFLNKIQAYLTGPLSETTNQPKNANLVNSIEDIKLALVEAFWQDPPGLIPQEEPVWCEAWLRTNSDPADEFRALCDQLGIEHRAGELRFPERVVILLRANYQNLLELIEASPYIAEFRLAKETARFWLELSNSDQAQWSNDLLSRLTVEDSPSVSICVIDTGVNNGHPLLQPVISDEDCYTVDTNWGTADSSRDGHGTLMSGLAVYGNLQKALESREIVSIRHKVESSKLLPNPGTDNDKQLYGFLTQQAISLPEIGSPDISRIACLAVTSEDDRDKGRPSSWSAAIDAFSSGADDDYRRLFVISAGNIESESEWRNYPSSNETNAVHDPGQSWNALTVGAYTDKAVINSGERNQFSPIANEGDLSPFSTTSLIWETSKWPVKPDIVLEGGNLAQDSTGFCTVMDDLSLLSTSHRHTERQFDIIYATSAAAAHASWMAAQIQTEYPGAWPETVRALLVHSADWPQPMFNRYVRNNTKTEYANLLRVAGYGVPNIQKSLSCSTNFLTLIAQQEIQPFDRHETDTSRYRTKDMHLYELPWPKGALRSIPGETPVQLRITLSYFIEPGPGEIGWKDKYRYPSFGLRFDLQAPEESRDEFIRRLNVAAREDGENPETASRSDRWVIGSRARDKGSLHSDIWRGTAAQISECNLVGIYPIIGWWRERAYLEKWDKLARYSLVVSLETPEQVIDIYTPVAVALGIPVTIQT